MNEIRKYLFFTISALFIILSILPVQAEILTLREVVEKAISFHPNLLSQKETLKATAYAKKALASQRWFQINFVAEFERHSDPVVVVPIKGPGRFPKFSRDIYFWETTLSFPLYEGGRVAKKVKFKELGLETQKSLLRQSAEDLIANVKQLYYQILFLKNLKRAQEEILSALKKQREEAALKFRLKKVAKLDFLYLF